MKVKSKMYFHASKESSLDDFLTLCEEHGIDPSLEAQDNAMYAGYEVGVDVEWDLETGNCELVGLSKQ